ncbi:MAG: DUF948 domain-containing protein [Nocardiopsaceae bacterium]|nr:DUF948 domain-containing protein [Nocardiopsaceae bacterium]
MGITGIAVIAALIAAVSFAVLTLTAVFVAFRLNAVLRAATALIREAGEGHETVLARVNAAVERTNAQLDRTEAVTSGMDKLGEGMHELSEQVSALTAFGRTMAGAVVNGPAGKAAAIAYGVRHAVVLRRNGGRALAGEVVDGEQAPRSVRDKGPVISARSKREPRR